MTLASDFWEDLSDPAAELAARATQAPSTGTEASELPIGQVWEPPGPKASAFYWSDAAVCLIRGPVGSGKTTANLRKCFRRALTMPRSTVDGVRRYKVVVARATYRQLWQTTIPSWFEVVPRKIGKWAGGRGDPVTHTIEFSDRDGPVEFVAEFLAFGETATEIQANMRGIQTTDMALEEGDTLDPVVFTQAITRIDRYPAKSHFQGGAYWEHAYPREQQSYGQINLSYNAPEEGNWILALEGSEDADPDAAAMLAKVLEDTGVEIAFFRQPGYGEDGTENTANLSQEYYPRQIAVMMAAGRKDDIKRFVYNKVALLRIGDPVFEDHFNERIHAPGEALEPWPGVPLRIGLDQGFFGAAVIAQFRPPFQWQILRELWFKKRTRARVFGLALRDILEDDPVIGGMPVEGAWGDIAGEQGNAAGEENEVWNLVVGEASGIFIEPQKFGHNRIQPRLEAWNAALDHMHGGEASLLIDPQCKLLRRGLANDYIWEHDVDKAGNRTQKPKKRGCRAADVIDAGGYMLLSEMLPTGIAPNEERRPKDRRPPGAPLARSQPKWSPEQGLREF